MISLHLQSIFHGPNPYAVDPVLVVEMTIEDGCLKDACAAVTALQTQTSDWYRPAAAPAGLPAAQKIGAFLADWSLQALTFVRGHLYAHGCSQEGASHNPRLWLGFHDPQLSLAVLALAARWLGANARPSIVVDRHAEELERLWQACRQRHPDYQAGIVMQAARQRGIPWAPAWGMARHWRFGQGERSRVLFESASGSDGHFGVRVASSKAATKTLLRTLGLPTPTFRLVTDEAQLEAAALAVGFPCVTKPLDRGGGKGVSTGLHDLAAVRQGYAVARAFSPGPVMVEAYAAGEDHRLLVVQGRLKAAIRRVPPSVTGDGQRTIQQLTAQRNLGCDARSLVRSGFRRPVVLDASARLFLAGMGLTVDTVLEAGRTVRLRSNANLSTGGDCFDVTEQIHPETRAMAEMLAQTLGLDMMGADYLCTNIQSNPQADGGQFIEINTTPGLDAMIAAGWTVAQAGDLALDDRIGRIATELLVLPMHTLEPALTALRTTAFPPGVGWASAEQAGLGVMRLAVTPSQPWAGVQALLALRSVSRTLIVASDSEIQRHGLPLDACETAHVLTVLPAAWRQVLNATCRRVKDLEPSAWENIILQRAQQIAV